MTLDLGSILNVFNLVVAFAALVSILFLVKGYGGSAVGTVLAYFSVFTFLLVAIRFFFMMETFGFVVIDDMTDMLIWHLLFYLAVVAFSMAATSLLSLITPGHTPPSTRTALWFAVFAVAYSVVVISVAPLVDEAWVSSFGGSWADHSGIFHIIALIMSWYIGFQMMTLRKKYGSSFASLALPLITCITALGLVHLWELLNESWKVIVVSKEIGGLGESIIWIPALFAIYYAFVRLKRLTSST